MSDVSFPPAENERPELKANVLLVDDTPANLLALQAILDDLGQNLVTATSGDEALRLLLDRDFAVVLLDVQMHGLDGFETAKFIRRRKRLRHMPIIFLTAQESEQFPVIEAYRLGAVDFLVKPLVPEIVQAKVAGFVELFKEKELARRQADQLHQLIQGATDYAIFMLDPQGRIATWNAGSERIKGYKAREIIGQHFSRFYPTERIDQGWPDQALARAATEGRFEDEGWRIRKDGSRFWANVIITALRDESGHLRGFSKVTRDLTERKQKEEDLHRLHRDLEKRVEERTAALAASNQALQAEVAERERAEGLLKEADRRKDEFLAMLAHELRNPLAPIRNGLQILTASHADRQTVGKARSMMERQIEHMTRIVDDLLDVSRIQGGSVTLRPQRLDLAQLARHVTEDHRTGSEDTGLKVELEVPEVPVWVQGDSTRLTQVLGNLLQNAIKFTDPGGQVTVRVEADTDRRQAVLTVRDTGMGIETDMLPYLFEAFAQADRSLDRSKGGLGLGLALVKGLVGLHGGTVQVVSEGAGHGTEFQVRLPQEQEPAALTKMPAASTCSTKRVRILVVEDNRDAADSLKLLLELFGHEVAVAYSGPAGVQAAVAWRPDVVLCDIGLPGLDGYGVVSELRRNPVTAAARIVAVTGYGQAEDLRRSQAAGFDKHLVKPVDPDALQEVIALAK